MTFQASTAKLAVQPCNTMFNNKESKLGDKSGIAVVDQAEIADKSKKELKDDWRDFKSPKTHTVELEDASGKKVVVEKDPVLIAPLLKTTDLQAITEDKEPEVIYTDENLKQNLCYDVHEKSKSNGDDSTKKQFVSPKDFELLKVIGMGAFGKVVQVRNKKSQKVLAMKVISKRLLRRKTSYVKQMQLERDILTKIRHPFIVTMHCSFQTKEKLFIVMDFLAGGELFLRLGKEGIFLESQARFYLAEMILALEHLHNHNVLHRDLKPENVLLGSDGHVCLTDFGLAKDFSVEQGYWSETVESENNEADTVNPGEVDEDQQPIHRARTICGTTEYMAPEMIARKGYGKAADFWSLGCIAYEMLSGLTPFNSRKGEKDIMRKILSERIKMPSLITADAVKLLKGLLNRNPQDRLGSAKGNMFNVGGVAGLKQIDFFKPINWTKLEKKEIEPPAKFAVESESDTQHFDEEFLRMNLPRSITEMSNDDFKPRRCASDQFRGFSYIQSDFDLPERKDEEWDAYWNSTADPDCDSASECASGVFSDNEDEVPVVSELKPKKKKKKKQTATTVHEVIEQETSSKIEEKCCSNKTETQQDQELPLVVAEVQMPIAISAKQKDEIQKDPVLAQPPSQLTKQVQRPKENPWISTSTKPSNSKIVRPTLQSNTVSNLSSDSSIKAKSAESNLHPSTPQSTKVQELSCVMGPSAGSYVPPHLRKDAKSTIPHSPGSSTSSSFRAGPSYLASPSSSRLYLVGSNATANGARPNPTLTAKTNLESTYRPAPGSWAAKMAAKPASNSSASATLQPRALTLKTVANSQPQIATVASSSLQVKNQVTATTIQTKQPQLTTVAPNLTPPVWPSLGGTSSQKNVPQGVWGAKKR